MMRKRVICRALMIFVNASVLMVPVVPSLLSTPAVAQTTGVVDAGEAQAVTLRAKVTAIDAANRGVTLVGPAGNTFVVHAGDEVRNFDQIKVGDNVVAKYYTSLLLVLAPPGTRTPVNSDIEAAQRAAKGQLPAAAIARRTVVTGLVVGIDLAAHTLSLVDRPGGVVHTVNVADPQKQAELKKVKVGDTLTAVLTEELAIGLDRG
jgi:hypothetical protein